MRHAPRKQINRPSQRVLELERMSNAELERVFLEGVTPGMAALAGWEFRGLNSPTWFRLIGIKKFIKGFYWDDGELRGYNGVVAQNGIAEPWLDKPSEAKPRRHGFYKVKPVDAEARDNYYLHALLLDYGLGDNPRVDPSQVLRDYLVQVDANNPDLFLGKAYAAIGPARLPTFSYFILERHRPGITSAAMR
jgi:hypothetical protein